MNDINIIKSKNLSINSIELHLDNNLIFNNKLLLIQSPIFNNYTIINCNSNKYLELHLDDNKNNHLKFLTLIDSLELKLKSWCYNLHNFKTQIITNIQNKKSLKVKLLKDTKYYDSEKNEINKLISNKISLLFKIDFNKIYYSWTVVQILQLK